MIYKRDSDRNTGDGSGSVILSLVFWLIDFADVWKQYSFIMAERPALPTAFCSLAHLPQRK